MDRLGQLAWAVEQLLWLEVYFALLAAFLLKAHPNLATAIVQGVGGTCIYVFLYALRAAMRKLNAQRAADLYRSTYVLEFPRTMALPQVLDFARSMLAETPNPKPTEPAYAISIEKLGDINGKCYYMSVPGHIQSKVDRLLEKKIDGVTIEAVKPADDVMRTTRWDFALELTMDGRGPFNIIDAVGRASSIDANFDNLKADEQLCMQWVVMALPSRRPTPETKDKYSDHMLVAVCRIGGVGEDARRNVFNLFGSLRAVNINGKDAFTTAKLKPRWRYFGMNLLDVSVRINRRAGTLGYPIIMNVAEWVTLVGWPLVASAGAVVARKIAPTKLHDTEGLRLGVSNHHKYRGRIIAMPPEAGDMHLRVMGGSGTGKSNFLLHYALQSIINPETAFFLLEPAGDLAWDILQRIPAHRVKDVIYLDPLDTNWPIGVNPFQGTDPERMAAHVVSIFKNLSPDSWGHQLQRVLTTAVTTTALLGLTLYDTEQLLVNEQYRQEQLKKLKRNQHPELFQEWTDFIGRKGDLVVDSSVNRIKSFLGSRMMRNMLSQRTGLDFDWIIREHKILIVPLPAARMGQMNASAVGQLVRELAWNAAMKQDPGNRQRSVVMMDEFQNFADFATSKSDPFAEARKYKQQYVIANQYTEQITEAVRHTVDKNVATQLVFRLDPEDAKKVKDRYAPLTAEDLSALPRYTVAARIMGSQGMAPTVTFSTLPPPEPTHYEREIIARTRAQFAKPLAEVDADIMTRHKQPETKRRPKIGEV